ALDLFAGVGLFSLPLARTFQRVTAVESNEAAARDLQINLDAAGPDASGQAVCADVERFTAGASERFDLVVFDPPRAGVPTAALQRIAQLAPQHIIYLSCDPATLARDLALLTAANAHASPSPAPPPAFDPTRAPAPPTRSTSPPARYSITDLQLFDLFPQSFHIESLARLSLR
ncbi:MAG: RsmD family RNA methyltransferase, partial [Candidatus Acidiferrales bacterium]